MFPIDVAPLDSVAASIPVLKQFSPEFRGVIITGVLVQAFLGAVRMAVTKKQGQEAAPKHWMNRFMGRFGPVVNVGLGVLFGLGTTMPMAVAAVGGGFSSWTFALVNKTIVPLFQTLLGGVKKD